MRDETSSPNPENPHQAWLGLIQDYVALRYPDVCADDVAQDTIEFVLRLRRNSARWQPTREFLKRAADRLAHAYRQTRQADRDSLHRAYVPDEVAGADEFVLEEANRRQLRQAWKMLSESDRALLKAIIGDGVKPQKVAEWLGISYDAVRKRKQRACSRLKRYFKQLGLLIPTAWFAVKGFGQRAYESSASAYVANATGMVTLVTIGIVGVSMAPNDPARDPESHARDVRPVVTATSGPDHDSRHPRPAGRTASPSVVRPPATPTTSPPGTSAVSASDGLPGHPELHVYPNTGKGTKETHFISVDAPMGPVVIRGRRHAPDPAMVAVVCERAMVTCPSRLTGTSASSP